MTYGDDRTAGAMGDEERRDAVRQSGEAMAAITTERGPGVPDELRERVSFGICMALHEDREYCQSSESGNWNWIADSVVAEIDAAGYVIVRERAIGDALSDAIMEATRQGWDDPDSAIWRRGMAAGHRTLGLVYPGDPEAGR